jgi:DNA-directed RNA polymerase specialized sigma24 family protein
MLASSVASQSSLAGARAGGATGNELDGVWDDVIGSSLSHSLRRGIRRSPGSLTGRFVFLTVTIAGEQQRAQVAGDQSLVARALRGERRAIDGLVTRLSPVVQARVARLLLARGRAVGSDLRAQVEDLTQDVFLGLFERDGRVLRSWAPDRGLSLDNFVGLVARRQVIALLRRRAASLMVEEATEERALMALADEVVGATLEERLGCQEVLVRVLARLELTLTPRSLALFERLFIRDESVDEVVAATGLSADAVYAWRSRLGKLARQAGGKVLGDEEDLSEITPGARTSRGVR